MGDWIVKEDYYNKNSNKYFSKPYGEFKAPISGFYEFHFMALVDSNTNACVQLNSFSAFDPMAAWKTELSSSCSNPSGGGWITLSAITKLAKNLSLIHI